jgi:hypothetical protein
MQNAIRRAVLAVTAFVLIVAGLYAQGTSQISGTVRDSSGLAVSGATVQVTQSDTGAVRTVMTAADGAFVLASIPIGPYRLQITKEGFSTYVQSGIVLQVDSNPNIDVSLQVGSVTEQVQVQADAAMVETRSTGVGQVVDQKRVVELPLNGRQPQYLIFLAGAAVSAPPGNLNSTKNYPTVVISVAGATAAGLTYNLDGSSHNDPYSNQAFPIPFPDALQEFKLETSALPAQYGQHSGAAVNAVTKSGSNQFHGDAFEFFRNGDVNSRDFFATSRDTLKRSQFGGTFGGPIKHDKLFFFLGYQGTLQRSDPTNGIAFIPTPTMQAGDFTAFAAAACQSSGRPLTLSAPFVGNKISPALLSPAALKIMTYYPVTNDPCGRETFGYLTNADEHLGLARGDYQISARQSLVLRWYGAHLVNPSPYSPGGNPLALNNAGIDVMDQSLSLGETYLITSSIVNSTHATLLRGGLDKFQNFVFGPKDVGIDAYSYRRYMVLTAGTFITGNVFAHAGAYYSTTGQLADDLSVQKGSHQFGFGANWIHSLNNNTINLNAAGQYTFNGMYTGTALGDFLTGQLSGFSQGNSALLYTRQHYIGIYAQDSWKLTPRLTLSYGLRWEPFLPVYMKQGRVAEINYQNFLNNVHSTVYTNAPAGMIFPGDPGYPGSGTTSKKLNNFMPRVGIVWDPKGDGNMTIRASYGRFYSSTHLFYDAQFAYNNPWGDLISLPPGQKLDTPWANYAGGNPFPLIIPKNGAFPVNGAMLTYPLHTNPPYMQQWNISIQRQLGSNWLISASYLGNNLIHGWAYQQINPGLLVPGATTGNISARRAFILANPSQGSYYSTVGLLDDGATAGYQGGLFSVQRRFSGGFTILANYTWSHCITDPIPNDSSSTGTYVNPASRRMDRGNCVGIDRRHLVNASFVYQTPRFSDAKVRLLTSNWQLSTILSVQSGPYGTVISGVDNALNGIANQRPNQISVNPYATNQSVNGWLNASSFTTVPNGTFGNLGVGNILLPGAIQLDMSLSRTFPIKERRSLQIRFEAFNVPNHLNPAAPNLTLNSPIFGKITSDITVAAGANAAATGGGDPRILQFAAKYTF